MALAISSSLAFFTPFQIIVRLSINLTSTMSSVQRMQRYSHLEQEKGAFLPYDNNLPSQWP